MPSILQPVYFYIEYLVLGNLLAIYYYYCTIVPVFPYCLDCSMLNIHNSYNVHKSSSWRLGHFNLINTVNPLSTILQLPSHNCMIIVQFRHWITCIHSYSQYSAYYYCILKFSYWLCYLYFNFINFFSLFFVTPVVAEFNLLSIIMDYIIIAVQLRYLYND